jgi:hypothetical protein
MSETTTTQTSNATAPAAAPTETAPTAATAATAALSGTLLSGIGKEAAPAPAPAADAKPEATQEAAKVEPVDYTKLELPEGLQSDDPALDTFRAEAAKLGLTKDHAQALVTAVGAKIAEAASAQMQAWKAMNDEWAAQAKADVDFGKANYDKSIAAVGKLFDDFVGAPNSPERKALNEALTLTGAGNHPAVFRAFAKVAAALNEGGHVAGSPARNVDLAALMYPSLSRSN